ncbi:MAG: FAD-binding protein, partial [Alphaproteobacteria bacterium]|nr:FAD-binding protein [Alphaproteobacteria bacterium]
MTTLVVADHFNDSLVPATLNTVTAATQLGGDVHVLVAGKNCDGAAEAASKIAGVAKVLKVDADHYAHPLAEPIAALVVSLAGDYDNILAPATTFGKNTMPRVAALLDVAQISDVQEIVSEDTFVRPIYAGNALATVQSTDETKVMTIRGTGFDAADAEGGSADIEDASAADDPGVSSFVNQELSKSDRPELTSAKIIVSGGRGMGSGENFKVIEALADKLGA